MRSVYNPREIKLGNDIVTEFTFGFKIVNKAHLLVLQVDITDEDEGVLTVDWSVYANDTTYFTTVLNADESGGKITFGVAPATGKRLILLLADDLPKQESKYTADGRYTMKKVEESLDALSGQIQRLRYLCDRSFQLPEKFTKGGDVQDDFDVKLVDLIANGVIVTDEDNGFVTTKTIETILTDAGIMQIITQASLDAANALAASQTATGNVAALAVRMTAAEGNITTLTNRMTAAEGDITELESDVIAHQADIEDLQTIVAEHEVEIGNLQTITDDHETRITANEAELVDHEARITNLEAAPSGGGGGGGSFAFYAPAGVGAVVTDLYNRSVFAFSKDGLQRISGELRSSIAATSNQKTITFGWFGTQDNVKWTVNSFLIKAGQAVDSGTFEYTESVEETITGNKELMTTTLNISDASGQIGAQDIDEGDDVLILISRGVPAGAEYDGEVYIMPALTKISFT